MKSTTPYQPEDFEKQEFRELVEMFETLKAKHARRDLSPLKFVEAFDNFVEALQGFNAWPEIETEVKGMKSCAATLFATDYEAALVPAAEQRNRIERWDKIHNPPPPFLEGGRADGNKS